MGDFEQVREAAEAIRARVPEIPSIAIVLGSGLGDFADSLSGSVTSSLRCFRPSASRPNR